MPEQRLNDRPAGLGPQGVRLSVLQKLVHNAP